MKDMSFDDEFDASVAPLKPLTPAQYVQLENANLVKRDLDSFPEELKVQAIAKYKVLAVVEQKIKGGWTQKNIEPIIDDLYVSDKQNKPSWRTVVRWRKSYIESDGSLASLVVKRHKMGNRTNRVKGDEVFFDQALRRFLDAKRPSVASAYQFYKDAIVIENESIIEGQIPIVSYKSFNQKIKKLPPYPVAVARHGKFRADQWFGYCASHIPPTRVLQRVEIDHTPLDLILLDDKLLLPIGRPYLTLLIDVFSGCVLGFHLSYKSPSYVSAAKAILHAVQPKESLDSLDIDLQNDWPCHGKIETLVVDNGAEFWSKSLEHACLEAKINIQFNPVRKPWLKPFVERFFGMINEYFLEYIPGKTFSNILEKEDYKPEKDAIMHFSTFVEEFHRWIVDVYHQDANSKETRIPILTWKRGVEVLPPLSMSDEEKSYFNIIMGIKCERTIGANGINFESLRYDSNALADYRKQYPQNKNGPKKIIKIDPDDLSSIHVYLEELEGYLEVPCTDTTGYTKKLSLHQHKIIKKVNREFIRENMDYLGLAKARMAIHNRIKEEQEEFTSSKSLKKLSVAKKQAQFSGVSNTGQGSIKINDDEEVIVSPDEAELKKLNELDSWDDGLTDLEAFE